MMFQGMAAVNGIDHNNHALQLFQQGDYEGAEQVHLKALESKLKSFKRDTIQVALTLNALGETQIKLGKLDDAEKNLRDSLATRERKGAKFDAAVTRENLAVVLEMRGNLKEALEVRKKDKNNVACGYYQCPGQSFTTKKLKRCGKCACIYYCSAACQGKDWPRHKAYCKKVEL